jgi:hypothetical protein
MDAVLSLLKSALNWVTALLPDSPFKLLDNTPIAPLLPYINWFIPFDFMVATFTAWLVAITVYYIYSVILRWVKAIN